jgi:hypothetical protein
MKYLGIDPGVRGALVVVEITDGVAPQLMVAIDIPVVGLGAKERVDVLEWPRGGGADWTVRSEPWALTHCTCASAIAFGARVVHGVLRPLISKFLGVRCVRSADDVALGS